MDTALIGAISNGIKGGQLGGWMEAAGLGFIYKKISWIRGNFFNALIFSLTVYGYTWDVIASIASFGLMFLGASIAHGDYIGAIGGWRQNGLHDNKYIDFIIAPLRKYPLLWGMAGMTSKGLFWGACLSLPFFWLGDYRVAILFLSKGALLGITTLLCMRWVRYRLPDLSRDDSQSLSWGLNEIMFGAVLWSAI